MDKDSILQAVIAIGRAVESSQDARERREFERENFAQRRDVGYAVGTKLFSFHPVEGIEEVLVVDAHLVKIESRVRYCTQNDVFAESIEEAIKAFVVEAAASKDLSDYVDDFESDIEYHTNHVTWAKMARDFCLLRMKEKQTARNGMDLRAIFGDDETDFPERTERTTDAPATGQTRNGSH